MSLSELVWDVGFNKGTSPYLQKRFSFTYLNRRFDFIHRLDFLDLNTSLYILFYHLREKYVVLTYEQALSWDVEFISEL